jgi:polar amino acid transport system substrate-binding protein
MLRLLFALAIALLLAPGPLRAEPQRLRVCANVSLGDPKDGNSSYLLARHALALLPDVRAEFSPLPWQRCLSEAAAGRFDAVLAASYTPARAIGLAYPLDAQGKPDADRRMFSIGYALLRRKGSGVVWDGQRFSGSSPRAGQAIGAERGYSIVLFARDRGAVVEDRYPSFGPLVDSLRLRRIAAVLINQEGAAQLLADPAWAFDHELGGPPLQTKAYYMPLSRAFADAHPALAQRLWDAVAKPRETPAFRQHFSLSMSGGRRRDVLP